MNEEFFKAVGLVLGLYLLCKLLEAALPFLILGAVGWVAFKLFYHK